MFIETTFVGHDPCQDLVQDLGQDHDHDHDQKVDHPDVKKGWLSLI